MQLSRRALLGGLAMSAFTGRAPAETGRTLRAGRAQATFAPGGGLLDLRYEGAPLVDPNLGDGCPELRVNGERLRCSDPVSQRPTPSGLILEYRFEQPLPLAVTYEVALRELPDGAAALVQKIAFAGRRDYSDPVEVRVPRNVRLPAERRQDFAPTREGIARRSVIPRMGGLSFVYKMAGGDADPDAPRLAVPLLGEYANSSRHRITLCAEPGFTTVFRNASDAEPGLFAWVHTSGARREERIERTFHTILGRASERQAVLGLYDTALAGVKAGPAWLHDVVMVHYDYLSKTGRGWFADIDALSRVIPAAERHRIVVTLHGWYDFVGRYAFDPKSRALDKNWVAFSNVTAPAFIAHATGPRSKTARFWGWRKTLGSLRPVEMSLDEMHRRMRYAKQHGFRCVLYFGDGVNSGDGLTEIHDPSKVLSWGGWIGPETSGRTYSQNPLHPDVRAFYRDYLQALLAEFGELDGLVWDETFHVRAGQTGTAACPGYADAAMMSLVGELRQITERHDPNLAFLSSDCLEPERDAPYALVSHGTYQDTMCDLKDWPYGLFPNLRNTLWSCNWYHQSTWDRNERSVGTYGFPVAISNGFGDDTGPSDMNVEQMARLLSLTAALGDRRLELSWIEEVDGTRTYNGRPVPAG